MKYKDIFKSWWFLVLVILYCLVSSMYNPITITSFLGWLGFIFGATIVMAVIISLAWGLLEVSKKIIEKLKKR